MADGTDDIIKADPAYRKRLFIAYGLILAAGAATVVFVLPVLHRALGTMSIKSSFATTEALLIALLLCFAGPATYIIVVGRRILAHGQVPCPGMKMLRDTKVVRGRKARLQGLLLVYLGVFSLIMSVAGVGATHFFFERFRNDAMFYPIFK